MYVVALISLWRELKLSTINEKLDMTKTMVTIALTISIVFTEIVDLKKCSANKKDCCNYV